MSRCKLIPFKRGKQCDPVEFSNAWGGSARIWDALFKAHVPLKHEYDSWLSSPNDRRLWDLATREDLPLFERAVHAFTFDRFYVRFDHFKRMAADLRAFVAKYKPPGVDHLPAWADWLESNAENFEAVGIHGTTVSESPWQRVKACQCCGMDSDDVEDVPLSEGVEVYDWLEGGC